MCDRRRYEYLFPARALDPAWPSRPDSTACGPSQSDTVNPTLEEPSPGRPLATCAPANLPQTSMREVWGAGVEAADVPDGRPACCSLQPTSTDAAPPTRLGFASACAPVVLDSSPRGPLIAAHCDAENAQKAASGGDVQHADPPQPCPSAMACTQKPSGDSPGQLPLDRKDPMCSQPSSPLKSRTDGDTVEESISPASASLHVPISALTSSIVHDADAAPQTLGGITSAGGAAAPVECSNSMCDDAALERLNALLSQYIGTHNFHNYTIRTLSSDPAALRYILSFRCVGVANLSVCSQT